MPSVNPSMWWIRKAKEVLGEHVSRERPALILTVASALQAAFEQGVAQGRAESS